MAVRNADSVLRKLFSGDLDFRKTSANFPPAERGLGNECGRDSEFLFLAAAMAIVDKNCYDIFGRKFANFVIIITNMNNTKIVLLVVAVALVVSLIGAKIFSKLFNGVIINARKLTCVWVFN